MATKEAEQIVREIRNNLIPITGLEQQVDEEKQLREIQKFLDKGIEVVVVDKPIIEHSGDEIQLSTFKIEGDVELPENIKKVFIWMWWKDVPPKDGNNQLPFGTINLEEEIEIMRMKWI